MHETSPIPAPFRGPNAAIDDGDRAKDEAGPKRTGAVQKLQTPEETEMLNFIKTFAKDEDGAVTVDWVVLTAAVVGLGIAVAAAVQRGAEAMGSDIGNSLDNATLKTVNVTGS